MTSAGPAGGYSLTGPRLRRPPLSRASDVAWFVAPFLVLLAVWVAVVAITAPSQRIFPQVDAVWRTFTEMVADGTLADQVLASLGRVLAGAALAIAIGIPFGVAMGSSRRVSNFFSPLLRFSVALAGIAWIPLATLWFGYGAKAVIFVVFNAVFFSIVYHTMLGVRQIPRELLRAARSMGAGTRSMFGEILLPGAMPSIVTGMRVGMGYAWRGLIAAEIIATSAGLGYTLFLARKFYETEKIVLVMILIGLIWLVMDRLLLAPLERRTVERWGEKRRAAL
jgi:taurine transport system permease protein